MAIVHIQVPVALVALVLAMKHAALHPAMVQARRVPAHLELVRLARQVQALRVLVRHVLAQALAPSAAHPAVFHKVGVTVTATVTSGKFAVVLSDFLPLLFL